MAEYGDHYEDPYAPSYLPKSEHLDAFPDDEFSPQQKGIMSEWEKDYQKSIECLTPDDKLLTAEAEGQLSTKIQAGLKAARDLKALPRMAETRRLELEDVASIGRASRDTLVTANLRLAAWFVRATMNFDKSQRETKGQRAQAGAIYKDLSSLSGGELDYSDRMQLASIGLIKAAEKFDAQGRFSTIAMYYMESELGRALFKVDSPFALPPGKAEEVKRFEKQRQALTMELDREPTIDEISRKLIMPTRSVHDLARLSHQNQQLSYENLTSIYNAESNTHDYGGVVHPEDEITLADMLPDHGVDLSTEDEVALRDLGSRLDEVMSGLNWREQQILEMRFGLVDGSPMTQGEVGHEFNVTGARIAQIEAKAIEKLKHPSTKSKLEEYLDIRQDSKLGISEAVHTSDATKAKLGVSDMSIRIGEAPIDQDVSEEEKELRYFPKRPLSAEELERAQADWPDDDQFYSENY